jgi:hypothetical protein
MSKPPPAWYLHACARMALQGQSVAMPIEPETEPTNVHSLEAARTRRATELMLRRRSAL